jgi:hypothetical protein
VRKALLLLFVCVGVASCGVKEDAQLFVYARNATLTKGSNAFGSKLDGTVDVYFDLGKYTQEAATIESISLGMYRDTKQVLPAAKIEPAPGTTFPLTLAPGSRKTITYTITRSQLIDNEPTELCAGPVKFTGTVKQTGKGELQIASDAITVAGCP